MHVYAYTRMLNSCYLSPQRSHCRGKMSARYCNICGASLQGGSSYCPNCGAPAAPQAVSTTGSPTYVIRRQSIAERRAERRQSPRSGYGGLIIATILVVVGVAVFFPELPWYAFWGCLWILLGVWIAYGWTQRGHGNSGPAQPATMNQ